MTSRPPKPRCDKCHKRTDLTCSVCPTPICEDCVIHEQGSYACSKECRAEIKESNEVEQDGW